MAPHNDKKYWKILGKELNPSIQKKTKKQILDDFNLANFFNWLNDSKKMIKNKSAVPESTSAAELIYKKAYKLGLVRYSS